MNSGPWRTYGTFAPETSLMARKSPFVPASSCPLPAPIPSTTGEANPVVLPAYFLSWGSILDPPATGYIDRACTFCPVSGYCYHNQEVLVTQRNWMALYLGHALQGRWKDLGDSVHVLRRVDGFLGRHFSADSEVRGWSCVSAAGTDNCVARMTSTYSVPGSVFRGRGYCPWSYIACTSGAHIVWLLFSPSFSPSYSKPLFFFSLSRSLSFPFQDFVHARTRALQARLPGGVVGFFDQRGGSLEQTGAPSCVAARVAGVRWKSCGGFSSLGFPCRVHLSAVGGCWCEFGEWLFAI